MKPKTMVIAIGILIAFCAGIFFYAEWQKKAFDASLPQPPPPEQAAHADPHAGHNHGPGEHHGNMIEVEYLEAPPEQLSNAEIASLHAGLPPSSVQEDIPERYQLPKEWRNVYAYEAGKERQTNPDIPLTEMQEFLYQVTVYVVENHNPGRPIAEVWPAFMEAEFIYNSLAEQDLGFFPGEYGGSRVEWDYEQVWGFPEVYELVLNHIKEGSKPNPLTYLVYQIELGLDSPNWNVIPLPDGRSFRTRRNYYYEFRYPGGGYSCNFVSKEKAERVVVVDNIFETSDEELERISGWDYNINPFTGRTIKRYRAQSTPEPDGEVHVFFQ